MPRPALHALLFACVVAAAPPRASAAPQGEFQDLTSLDLEQLMAIEVEVTSATRRAQPRDEVPGAIFVLTGADLRSAGVTNLPDALRLVPGMQVARLDSNRWAVTARGFNDQFSNKLLILVDGRTIYTPLFSGVFWDAQDVPIEDIERIEVIRGPGAVMWGSNAVNGVISILTKPARETQGPLLSVAFGSEERALGGVRWGGELAPDAHYRVWARGFERDASELDGVEGDDAWSQARAGFRLDWQRGARDAFTFQGDTQRSTLHNTFLDVLPSAPYAAAVPIRTDVEGAYALGRWTREHGDGAQSALQLYVDRTERVFPQFGEERTTYDLDFQRHAAPGERHDVVWGFGVRYTRGDVLRESFRLSFDDSHRSDALVSVFAQDEYTLVPDTLALTLGAKFEHRDDVGLELQPNARLLWKPDARQRVWASVSRAVRSPSWAERDVRVTQAVIPGPPDTYVVLMGDGDADVETLVAYELGYRVQLDERTSLDATAYHFEYDELLEYVDGTPFMSGGNVIVPVQIRNAGQATSDGVELALERRVGEATTVAGSLSLMHLDDDGAADDNAPAAQAVLRVAHDWSARWTSSAWLAWVDGLDSGDVPAYLRLDARLEWRPTPGVRAWCAAQGLFHDGESEFGDTLFVPTQDVEAAFLVGLTWGR